MFYLRYYTCASFGEKNKKEAMWQYKSGKGAGHSRDKEPVRVSETGEGETRRACPETL